MRKIILGLVAATAVAAPIALTTGPANAATTDANGVVTVAKGEIMAQFPGMNETAFQNGPKALVGSDAQTFTTETVWGCTDGSLQHHFRNTIRTTAINFAPIVNQNGKTTGWTMTKGASTFTENNTGGTRFPTFTCPAGTSADFSQYSVLTPTVSPVVTSTTFNGSPVSIVVNPYVAPVPVA